MSTASDACNILLRLTDVERVTVLEFFRTRFCVRCGATEFALPCDCTGPDTQVQRRPGR